MNLQAGFMTSQLVCSWMVVQCSFTQVWCGNWEKHWRRHFVYRRKTFGNEQYLRIKRFWIFNEGEEEIILGLTYLTVVCVIIIIFYCKMNYFFIQIYFVCSSFFVNKTLHTQFKYWHRNTSFGHKTCTFDGDKKTLQKIVWKCLCVYM